MEGGASGGRGGRGGGRGDFGGRGGRGRRYQNDCYVFTTTPSSLSFFLFDRF